MVHILSDEMNGKIMKNNTSHEKNVSGVFTVLILFGHKSNMDWNVTEASTNIVASVASTADAILSRAWKHCRTKAVLICAVCVWYWRGICVRLQLTIGRLICRPKK